MITNQNIKFNHCRNATISVAIGICGAFLFAWLTFIPTQTFAADIVDPTEKRSLSNITNMQDMNQQICINSKENETKQLVDSRDSKKYWVTKLKDGNCWMTQNLDYDGGGIKITNLAAWEPGSSVTNTTAAYYNPDGQLMDGEKYYYNGPDGEHGWNSNGCSYDTVDLSDCAAQGFVAATSGDTHYLVGNYYSWHAAVNGTGIINGKPITSGEASGSVCPEGWRLPTSGGNDKDFGALMQAYGWVVNNPDDIALTMNNSAGIYGSPLYFVYGGSLNTGHIVDAGSYGNYWSSTPVFAGTSAYGLGFGNKIYLVSQTPHWIGRSVRCLAEGHRPLADNQANVSITVSPVISIDVTKHADDMTVDFTQVAKSSIVARVGSNQPYQVLFGTDESNLTSTNTEQNIPMITADQKIVKGTSSWGIKKLSSPTDITVDDNTIYSPVGIGGQKELFYTSASAASEDLTFPVAIAVDSSLSSGKYSTQVTLTAVAM